MNCRPFEKKDLPFICAFPQNADELFFLSPKSEFPLSPSQLLDTIEQRSDSTVVEHNGKVVAFANFYQWEFGGRCSIGNVIVSSASRGQGVGRYLIKQMINLAFSKHKAEEVVARTHFIDNGPDYFNEGLARTISKNKYGYIDEQLNIVIKPEYDFVFPFGNGKAIVCNDCVIKSDGEHNIVVNGTWGVINNNGEILVPLKYSIK